MISGTCHCKKISFEIDENKLYIRYCYCETCRKLSGADYSSVARVTRERFRITKGKDNLLCYESRPGKNRFYCNKCFAPIYVVTDNETTFLRVRLGVLDGQPDVEVTGHMWVSEKPVWRSIEDGLPIYTHEYTEE
jgi:hypothetical protein